MEQQNDFRFSESLESRHEHKNLDRHRGDDEKIVARQNCMRRIEKMRGDKQRDHRAAEQAGPGLLRAEAQKLIERRSHRPRRDSALTEPSFKADETDNRRPEPRRTLRRHRIFGQRHGHGGFYRAEKRQSASIGMSRRKSGAKPVDFYGFAAKTPSPGLERAFTEAEVSASLPIVSARGPLPS